MIRRPPRSTQSRSSAASDVYKRQQIASVNPGQGYNTALYLDSAYYQPSQSPVTAVTVQQEQVAGYPAAPLPTDYWTRPIPIDFREWWVIGGQYPFVGQGGGPVSYTHLTLPTIY